MAISAVVLLFYFQAISCLLINSPHKSEKRFAALKNDGSLVSWGSGSSFSLSSGVDQVSSTYRAMAALKDDGSVITWGKNSDGGDSSSVSASISSGVIAVYSTYSAFAALKHDGSVITWGDSTRGGDSSSVSASLSSDVITVYSSYSAFAALKSDGSVITWGDSTLGGDSSSVSASLSSDVIAVYATYYSFAALKSDGSVITWGNADLGGDSSSVSASLSGGVSEVYPSVSAFAALKDDGSVILWGHADGGGDAPPSVFASLSSGVTVIDATFVSFAALKSDGSVITWGATDYGGDSSSVSASLSSGVAEVYATAGAFAALKNDGSVITWGKSFDGNNEDLIFGGDSSSVAANISSGVIVVYSTEKAFAALKSDGSVITWGKSNYGGDSSSVSASLSSGVAEVYSTMAAFAALKNDGSVITWGKSNFGGDSSGEDLSSGFIWVFGSCIHNSCKPFSTSSPTSIPTSPPSPGPSPAPTPAPTPSPTPAPTPQPSCPWQWKENFANCYHVFAAAGGDDFSKIAADCAAQDAHLVTIDSQAENDWIFSEYSGNFYSSPVTIGYNDLDNDGVYSWDFGSSNYSDLSIGSPGECASLYSNQDESITYWASGSCSQIYRYMCEWAIPPSPLPTSQPSSQPSSSRPTSQPTAPSGQPTGQPSGEPTCGFGSSGDRSSCETCDPGYFRNEHKNFECLPCARGTFNTVSGSEYCDDCNTYPFTTVFEGETSCTAVSVDVSNEFLLVLNGAVVVLYAVSIIFVQKEKRLALFVITLFPTFDVVTDLNYILTTRYVGVYLFAVSVIFILVPNVIFIRLLLSVRSATGSLPYPNMIFVCYPGMKYTNGKVLWLRQEGGFPLSISGSKLKYFEHHDSIPKVIGFVIVWVLIIILQILCLLLFTVWFCFASLFLFFWFLMGLWFFQSKALATRRIWNLWLYIWTGSDEFEKSVEIDVQILNESLFAEFLLETLPQLCLQFSNNQLARTWNLISYLSMFFSVVMAFNGTYRFSYWVFIQKKKFNEIPAEASILGLCRIIIRHEDFVDSRRYVAKRSKRQDAECQGDIDLQQIYKPVASARVVTGETAVAVVPVVEIYDAVVETPNVSSSMFELLCNSGASSNPPETTRLVEELGIVNAQCILHLDDENIMDLSRTLKVAAAKYFLDLWNSRMIQSGVAVEKF